MLRNRSLRQYGDNKTAYITKNTYGDPFSTVEELNNTSTFYNCGNVITPSANDYCLVLADIIKGKQVTNYNLFSSTSDYLGYYILHNNSATLVTVDNKDGLNIVPGTTICYNYIPASRYIYQLNSWKFQYIISISTLDLQVNNEILEFIKNNIV